ncbi:MAG: Gfo/Idh/MocA family oxidoreductase [Gammaproteobacteria bacterium]|nr:Gfo/Idh/MocA family oxidoreductase [Gammaproteobacteria bacterium]
MTDKTIRVGVIGAGGNTRKHHIPKLQAQPGVEIACVVNRTRESGERVAKEFGIASVQTDWQAVVNDDSIDAICIGTWPYMHAPMTIAALQAGKHVLTEARMARNAEEARTMLAASRLRPDLVAQIVPAPHTLPFDQTINELIASGAIGELIVLDAHVSPGSDYPNPGSAYHWRHDRELSGNNVMSMGIWYEAIMRWIGPAASVQAMGQAVVPYRLDTDGRRRATSIPDHIHVLSAMQQGGQLHLNVSTVLGHSRGVDVHLHGTQGTLRLTGPSTEKMTLWRGARGDAALQEVTIDPAKRGGWRVEEEFVNAIRGREPVTHTDFATGLRYMEWTDAVAQSLRSGDRVDL